MSVISVDSSEENDVETRTADGIVASFASVDVGTFELEHDLLFETESICATPGPAGIS